MLIFQTTGGTGGVENGRVIRFATFELDRHARQLRKRGLRLKIEDQPFELLSSLLERPGEILTRDELRQRLWPDGTFVDFDKSLANAVNKVRLALGDSAANPRFVETVPRRGYRFVAPVSAGPPAAAAPPVRRRRRVWLFVILAVVAALPALLFLERTRIPAVVRVTQLTNDGRMKWMHVLTDGSRIYFSELVDGVVRVAQTPVKGDETHPVTIPFEGRGNYPLVADLRADRQELLISNAGALRVVSLTTGASRVLSLAADLASWSPDGSRLAYVPRDRPLELRVGGPGPDAARTIATMPGRIAHFAWSLDGSRIRLTAAESLGGPQRLWDVASTGGAVSRLLGGWPLEAGGGAWLDSGVFVFSSFSDGDLWAAAPGAGQPVRLTSGPIRYACPTPVPGTRKLIARGQVRRGQLHRYSPSRRAFEPFLGGLSADCLEFSPDRRWIAYVTYPEMELWRSRPDGSARLKLTSTPMQAYMPRWSPDGRSIAFIARTHGSPWKLHLIAPGGGAAKRLIAGPGPEADPAWSPGGRKLAFAPFLGEVESRRQRISVVDLDTGAIAAVPGSDGLWSPRWSPDGARFAALDERFRLCLLRPQDGSKLHVADSAGFPQWSPDGASLYYLLGAQQMIVRSSVPGLRAAPIIALTDSMAGNIVASDASHNSWVGFDPDGAPMILRDSGSEEVYAIELSPK